MFFFNTYYATNLGGALWTLAVEMQFYLLFPLLARAFLRMPALTFAGMVGISLAFRGFVGAHFADVGMYFNQLPAYLDVFACGHGRGGRACSSGCPAGTALSRACCARLARCWLYGR